MWAAFQDSRFAGVLGVRSMWPSMVEPNVLLDQLLQVRFRFAGNARPSAWEPVMASCQFGCMPTPAIMLPRSVSAVCWLRLLLALCRSSTSLAMTVPLEFCQGPLPMRSRALTGPPWANAVPARMDTYNLVLMGSPPVLMQAVLTMQVSINSFPYRPEHNTASRTSLAIGSLAKQLSERGAHCSRKLTSVAQSEAPGSASRPRRLEDERSRTRRNIKPMSYS